MPTGTMASSIAQPLASPLSSERSPNRLSYSFPPSSPSESQPSSQVFTSLDGKSSGSTVSPHRHPPMSEKSHCPNISPKRGRNRRPVVPKLRVPTQRHPSWGIPESQGEDSPDQCPLRHAIFSDFCPHFMFYSL